MHWSNRRDRFVGLQQLQREGAVHREMDRFVEELVEAGGPGDLPEKDGRHASVVGFCPCQRDKCFSFDAVHEPHLVILCDCSDW